MPLTYSAVTAMVVTALHSLASSQTAGWQSEVVDNSVTRYEDVLVQAVCDFANTAPANDKTVYVFAYGGLDATYTNPATGTQGAITLTNIGSTALNLRLIGTIAYETQDEVAESQPFSVAAAFGGILPKKWGLVIMNYSGAALAASGNSVSWQGVTS